MRTRVLSVLALGAVATWAWSTVASADPAMEDRVDRLEQEVRTLHEQRAQDQATIQQLKDDLRSAREGWSESYSSVEQVQPRSEEDLATAHFMLTGYGDVDYFDRRGGPMSDGSFQLGHFNPILHYRMGDRLTWVTELEFELRGAPNEANPDEFENELEIGLEYSYLDYEIRDCLSFQAGKFFLPLGIFGPRLHPAWINKLPTHPLPYMEPIRMVPETDVGLMLSGGKYIGSPWVNYNLAVTNGPGQADVDTVMDQGAATDNNNNKTWSGRVGIVPYPGFEFGVSGWTGSYSNDSSQKYQGLVVDGSVQLFDNMLDLRGEYINSTQERALSPDVDRDGWWIQGAHRFGWCQNPYVQNTELVLRYGEVNSDIFEEDDRDDFAVGLNYYIMNNFIFRVAYDWYDGNTEEAKADQFTAMLTYGF